jgi:hypothetical protein
MAGRHRFRRFAILREILEWSRCARTPVAPGCTIVLVDGLTGIAHCVSVKALAAGRRAGDCYVASAVRGCCPRVLPPRRATTVGRVSGAADNPVPALDQRSEHRPPTVVRVPSDAVIALVAGTRTCGLFPGAGIAGNTPSAWCQGLRSWLTRCGDTSSTTATSEPVIRWSLLSCRAIARHLAAASRCNRSASRDASRAALISAKSSSSSSI